MLLLMSKAVLSDVMSLLKFLVYNGTVQAEWKIMSI